jgi:hypothetical protein
MEEMLEPRRIYSGLALVCISHVIAICSAVVLKCSGFGVVFLVGGGGGWRMWAGYCIGTCRVVMIVLLEFMYQAGPSLRITTRF